MNERIKALRQFFEMNQSDFGKKLGVGKTAISKIENGDNNVTETMVKLVCSEFGVSEEWLRTGEGPMFPPQDENEELASLFGSLYNKENAKKRIVAMGLRMTDEEAEAFEQFVITIYNGLFTDKK